MLPENDPAIDGSAYVNIGVLGFVPIVVVYAQGSSGDRIHRIYVFRVGNTVGKRKPLGLAERVRQIELIKSEASCVLRIETNTLGVIRYSNVQESRGPINS